MHTSLSSFADVHSLASFLSILLLLTCAQFLFVFCLFLISIFIHICALFPSDNFKWIPECMQYFCFSLTHRFWVIFFLSFFFCRLRYFSLHLICFEIFTVSQFAPIALVFLQYICLVLLFRSNNRHPSYCRWKERKNVLKVYEDIMGGKECTNKTLLSTIVYCSIHSPCNGNKNRYFNIYHIYFRGRTKETTFIYEISCQSFNFTPVSNYFKMMAALCKFVGVLFEKWC